METKPDVVPSIRIIKINTCSNLSGKCKLTYHVGCDEKASLYFRVYENSGGGYFSYEWVALDAMNNAIDTGPKPTTSYALFSLFLGKSVNTPAFLLSAMVTEGLVQRDTENPRCYIRGNASAFDAEMATLIASDTNLKVTEKRKPRPKAPAIAIPVFNKKQSKRKQGKP